MEIFLVYRILLRVSRDASRPAMRFARGYGLESWDCKMGLDGPEALRLCKREWRRILAGAGTGRTAGPGTGACALPKLDCAEHA